MALYRSPDYQIKCPLGSGEEVQNSSHDGHFGFLIRTTLAIFYLRVTLMLPTKFGVNRLRAICLYACVYVCETFFFYTVFF